MPQAPFLLTADPGAARLSSHHHAQPPSQGWLVGAGPAMPSTHLDSMLDTGPNC